MRPNNAFLRVGAELRQASQDAALVALTRAYPDWHVWRSPLGMWYAMQRGAAAQVRAATRGTLSGTTLEALSQRLAEHAKPLEDDGIEQELSTIGVSAALPRTPTSLTRFDRSPPGARARAVRTAMRQAEVAIAGETRPGRFGDRVGDNAAPLPVDRPADPPNGQVHQEPIPALDARPVTRPWNDLPGALFSWEVAHSGGSAWGIARTEQRAIEAVTDALHEFNGRKGIVQEAHLGFYRGNERDQYCYGRVIARAIVIDGVVKWETP